MRRVWPLLLLALVALAVIHPLFTYGMGSTSVAKADEVTSISRLDTVFEVGPDGRALVTETITVTFPEEHPRHGIFRFFDEVDPHDDRARRVPEIDSVTRDGRAEEFAWETRAQGRFHVLVLGRDDVVLDPGTHTYVIQYALDRLLVAPTQGTGARFVQDVVPGGWQQPISQARVTVRLPASSGGATCTLGPAAEQECEVSRGGTSTVVATASDLPPRTALTLDVTVPEVEPSGSELLWSPRVARILGVKPWYVALVGAGVAYAAWLGRRLGRRSVERSPEVLRRTVPPSAVGPHQALFLAHGEVPDEAFGGALLLAAQRGAVRLSQDEGGWTLAPGDSDVEVDEVTAWILESLGVSRGETVRFDRADAESGEKILAAREGARAQAVFWAERNGFVEGGGAGKLGAFGVVAAFAAFAFLLWLGRPSTSLAAIPGVYAACALPLLRRGASTVRTESGRRVWAETVGFAAALRGDGDADTFDFSGREGLHADHLPWAVAFGLEERWAHRFRAETGLPVPEPLYVTGLWSGADATSMPAADFVSVVDSAVGAYSAGHGTDSSTGASSGSGGSGGGGSW